MANITEVAKELRINKSTLSRWLKDEGCPPLSAGGKAIKSWRDNTKLDRGPKIEDDDDDISLNDIEFILPSGSDPEDVLACMEKAERRLSGMIEAWEENKKLTAKQSVKLSQLRREYRDTSKLVIAAHRAILEMNRQKKVLVEFETADKFVMTVLEEILKFPRRLPARGKDQSERDLLKQISIDFQRVISEASTTARHASQNI